jgi:acetylornithine deacetylase/succinyl-diaminopimelate desuccinylase-like protein
MRYHHTHTDDRLTVGCPACADHVKADQARADLDEAPRRRLTFTVTYRTLNPKNRAVLEATATFKLVRAVPAGWTPDDVLTEYHDAAFETFSMGLPDSWTYEQYDMAHESAVFAVKIGDAVVPDVAAPAPPALDVPLFDMGAAS